MIATKDQTKEEQEAAENKKKINQALVKTMLDGDRKRKGAAAAAGGVAILSPGADDVDQPEALDDDDGIQGGSQRPKRRNTLSIMEMREKNKERKLELQTLAMEERKLDREARRKKDEAQAKLIEALTKKMMEENK